MQTGPASPGDASAIHALERAAFGQPDEAQLVDALRAGGLCTIELVVRDGGALLGHLVLSPMQAPEGALGLGPVAVAPGAQGRGIGSALIRQGLELAREGGWRAVFVVGEPEYYTRFGFAAATARGYDSPYAGPYLMALELVPGALALPAGGPAPRAEYAAPFAQI